MDFLKAFLLYTGDPFKEQKLYNQKCFMDDVFREFIAAHRETMDTSVPPKDFIDAYLRAIEEEKDKEGTTFYGRLYRNTVQRNKNKKGEQVGYRWA